MKKLLICLFIITILMTGMCVSSCSETAKNDEQLIKIAQKHSNLEKPEDYKFEIVGHVQEKEHVLYIFKISTELSVDCEYLTLDFKLIDSHLSFSHKFWPKEVQGGNDILVVRNWHGKYVFFVNDPRCKSIHLFDGDDFKVIPVNMYPFVYSSDRFFSGYSFVDVNGNDIGIT